MYHLPNLEVYGTHGTLSLPDPNTFDGDVLLRRHSDDEWRVLPPIVPIIGEPDSAEQLQRGPGVADLVAALETAKRDTDGLQPRSTAQPESRPSNDGWRSAPHPPLLLPTAPHATPQRRQRPRLRFLASIGSPSCPLLHPTRR